MSEPQPWSGVSEKKNCVWPECPRRALGVDMYLPGDLPFSERCTDSIIHPSIPFSLSIFCAGAFGGICASSGLMKAFYYSIMDAEKSIVFK